MSLNSADIKRIAHLARIEVSDTEAEATLTKLTGILGLIEQMQAVDTKASFQCHIHKMLHNAFAMMW